MADIDVVAVLRRMAFQASAERLSQEDASVPDHRQQSAEDAQAIAAVAELIAAAGPFVVTNSGDEHTAITVKSDDIRRLRHALSACKPTK